MRRLLSAAGGMALGAALLVGGFPAGTVPASASPAQDLPDYTLGIWHLGNFDAVYCLNGTDQTTGRRVSRTCSGTAKRGDRVNLTIPRGASWPRVSLDIAVAGGAPAEDIVISAGYNETLGERVGSTYFCRTFGDGVHVELSCIYDEQAYTFYER